MTYNPKWAKKNIVVKRDGTNTLTGDWNVGDKKKIILDELRMQDSDGITITDTSGVSVFHIDNDTGTFTLKNGKVVSGSVFAFTALRNYSEFYLANGDIYYVRYRSSIGDAGGGYFKYVTGAAPGTYTDDDGITILPSSSDGSTAWIRIYNGPISVLWFGADNSGSNDCSTSVGNAIDTAVSKTQAIYFPSGNYRFDSQIVKDISSGDGNLVVFGESPITTRLYSYNTSGIFNLTGSNASSFEFRNIWFAPKLAGAGNAIDLTGVHGTRQRRSVRIYDCRFMAIDATDGASYYWDIGIKATALLLGLVSNCMFRGLFGGVTAMTGISLGDHCISWTLETPTMYNVYRCVDVYQTDDAEGLYIINPLFVKVGYGVRNIPLVSDPSMEIAGGHISSYYGGVECENLTNVLIHEVLFFMRDDSDSTAAYYDIKLIDCDDAKIFNNKCNLEQVTQQVTQTFLLLDACDRCQVYGNNVARRHYGMSLENNSSSNQFWGNLFQVMLAGGKNYNVHNSTAFENFFLIPYFHVRATLGSAQNIPTADWTPLDFASQTAVGNSDGSFEFFDGTTTSVFTVPNGVFKVKVNAGVTFASNASGERGIRVVKNGVTLVSPSYVIPASSSTTTSVLIEIQTANVVPGDTIEIQVYQSSGSGLNTSSNGSLTYGSIRPIWYT